MQDLLNSIGVELDAKELEQLHELGHLIRQKNEELNLTSFKELGDICEELIVDSLMLITQELIEPGQKIIDVGSGAGVPGLPLAIVYPETEFVLLDSSQKKMKAAESFIEALGLKNVTTLSERAEDVGQMKEHREQYDIVISKACAALPVLMELCTPLIKVGGMLVAYKGRKHMEELAAAKNAMEKLHLEQPMNQHYTLVEDRGQRTLMLFQKAEETPKEYPRRSGTPNKNPL